MKNVIDKPRAAMAGFICGGVISQSQHDKNLRKYGVWADTMSWVMDDKHFAEYQKLKEASKDKEAEKIFKKFAISQI